jgi:hypothetical protein
MIPDIASKSQINKKFLNQFSILIHLVLVFLTIYCVFTTNNLSYLLILFINILVLIFKNHKYFYLLAKSWMALGYLLQFFISPIILFIIFFLFLLPLSLILKVFRINFLGLNYKKQTKTYWIEKNVKYNLNSFKDQF